jgi:amidohydrolase
MKRQYEKTIRKDNKKDAMMSSWEEKWKQEFEWFHRHPEVGNHEVHTTAHIRALLEEMGIEIVESSLKTGLLAVIRGENPGPEIGLRADIDALPVTEQTELPYRSENDGTKGVQQWLPIR